MSTPRSTASESVSILTPDSVNRMVAEALNAETSDDSLDRPRRKRPRADAAAGTGSSVYDPSTIHVGPFALIRRTDTAARAPGT